MPVSVILVSDGCRAVATGKQYRSVYVCVKLHTHGCLIGYETLLLVILSSMDLEGATLRCFDALLLLFDCPCARDTSLSALLTGIP